MQGRPKYTIGREKTCAIPIADDSVSRLHAEISLSDMGQIVLTDLRSSNGTTIVRRGVSITVRTEILQPTDEVRFGDVTLSARVLIETIEHQTPGALSGVGSQAGSQAIQAPASPDSPHMPPPPPVGAPAGRVVRCECGAIKTIGIPCPGCRR